MRRVPNLVMNANCVHVHQKTCEEVTVQGKQRRAVYVRFTVLYPIRFRFDFHGGWLKRQHKQRLLCVFDGLLILISIIKFD